MKETGLTGKRRSTTIAVTPDMTGTARGKEEETGAMGYVALQQAKKMARLRVISVN